MESHRIIAREFADQGFTVVPSGEDQAIPLDASAVGAIDEALKSAEMSIHLLGEEAGFAPSKCDPIVKLQLARAAARLTGSNGSGVPFRRIIWAPSVLADGSNGAAPTERSPVDVLKQFDAQLPSDAIVGDTRSKFVQFLKRVLAEMAPRPVRPVTKSDGDMRVYLCHAQEDMEFVFGLVDELEKRPVELVLPVFEGPQADIEHLHHKNLTECDAVALCWASAPEVWVRAQSSALRDWQFLGRKHQFAYRGVVVGPPPGVRKKQQAVKYLFPRGEIDLTINLTESDRPLSELLDPLVPH
jgi:hypothetical protein